MTAPRDLSAGEKRRLLAHVAPMLVFVLFIGLNGLLKKAGAAFWLSAPEFWVYPLQTLLCAGLLFLFRREYDFQPLRRPFFVVLIALLVFMLWIAPQQFLDFPARRVGFNLEALRTPPAVYWLSLLLRFLRLVVVVPLVEEIFWRAFLLRYLISEKFDTVPFGTFSSFSFIAVTAAFTLSHSLPDWPAAILAGGLYNFVAYRTKSLTSCVLAHGLTNLALGIWIVASKQWGFW